MFFVSKKKYEALLKQKKDLERIATNAVAQNGRLLDEWHDAMEEMKSIQKLNHDLVDRNEELAVELVEMQRKYKVLCRDYEVLMSDYEVLDAEYIKMEGELDHYEERCRYLEDEVEDKEEFEAKLDSATRHIKLADDTIFAIEDALYRQKGDDFIQLHIDEYYEEVKFLDTK